MHVVPALIADDNDAGWSYAASIRSVRLTASASSAI
jgi:hypothetical protein